MNRREWMGTMMLLATSIESKAADLFGKSDNLSANKGKETEQDAGLLPNKEKKHPANNAAYLKEVRKLHIKVGARKPFSALHIADSHLTRVDARENERKHALSASRVQHFLQGEAYFSAALRYARQNNLLLLHSGDVIDFVSEANLDYVAEQLLTVKAFVSAGNHEYSQYVGEAKEDEAYKAQSYACVQEAYPNDLRMASQVVHGVNFISLDDVYYHVTKEQYQWMKKQVERGLPIVLVCHVPFYTEKHCQQNLRENNGLAAYMTGVPEDITKTFQANPSLPEEEQWRNRSVQQKADIPTLEFIAWLKQQPLLKAILAGHCHAFYEERFSPTAVQYTVGAGYEGAAYEIEFE